MDCRIANAAIAAGFRRRTDDFQLTETLSPSLPDADGDLVPRLLCCLRLLQKTNIALCENFFAGRAFHEWHPSASQPGSRNRGLRNPAGRIGERKFCPRGEQLPPSALETAAARARGCHRLILH